MKIIIADSLFSPYGGGQVIAYNTYKILKEKGCEVFYFAMDKKPYFEEDYEYQKYFTPYYSGIKDYLKNPIKYYYNYRAKNDLQRYADFIKPDIIHYQSFWGLTSSVFNIKTKAFKILTLHDARCCPAVTLMFKNQRICFEQYCKNGNLLPCIKNKCAKNSIEASIRRAVSSCFDYRNFKNIDYFTAPSDALKNVLIKSGIGITESNITTISNFLDNEQLKTKPSYTNKGYFLYSGRLSKEKGVNYLLEAAKKLPEEINIHIAGAGKEEQTLKQYAEENSLTNVKFLGFLDRAHLEKEYQNCIASILPSNCFETFGLVNIESFINGKPVIASNIGAVPEIVKHNKTGLLFEAGNAEALKNSILSYWNNPDLAVEHGKNGYIEAVNKYSANVYITKIIDIYNKINNLAGGK